MKYLPLSEPCLKWQKNFSNYQFLIEKHLGVVSSHFQKLFHSPGLIDSEIKRAWVDLEVAEHIRFLIDPDAAELIFIAIEDTENFAASKLNLQLEDLMAAQLLRSGAKYVHPRQISWAKDHTLMTSNGLRLDTNSMLHNLANPKIKSIPTEQAEFYLKQINKALEIIAEVSPEALSLIENFTTTIHLRENPFHPNYASWSTHIGVGKISAMNFGEIANDLAEVCDFLIHESIHNFLHLVEEYYGPFLEEKSYKESWIKEKIVASPWSGKKVDLGSYTHAICVWYGLAQFWIRAKDYKGKYSVEMSEARVERMIHQASVGFVKTGNVHLAAEDRFEFINKDFLKFSLNYQSEIGHYQTRVKYA